MKKTFQGLVAPILIAILGPVFLGGDCGGSQNMGYHHVEMEWLSLGDHIGILKDGDPEKVYNSLCMLDKQASSLDQQLTVDSLKGLARHDTCLTIYELAAPLMRSKDPWVSSAAIRFLGDFKYGRKAYLENILRNNVPERNIQMEICAQLTKDSLVDQSLWMEKFLFLRRQKDWLLRNSSYEVAFKMDSCPVNLLMEDIQRSPEPDTRMLALHALSGHITDSVFHFLADAREREKDPMIRNLITSTLIFSENMTMLPEWLGAHPEITRLWMPEIIEDISDAKMQPLTTMVILDALRKGWKPSEVETDQDFRKYPGEPKLYGRLLSDKYRSPDNPDSVTLSPGAKAIEDALLKDPVLSREWISYQEKMGTKPLPLDLILAHQRLTEEYLRKSSKLMEVQVTDTAAANAFQRSILNDTRSLYKSRVANQKGD